MSIKCGQKSETGQRHTIECIGGGSGMASGPWPYHFKKRYGQQMQWPYHFLQSNKAICNHYCKKLFWEPAPNRKFPNQKEISLWGLTKFPSKEAFPFHISIFCLRRADIQNFHLHRDDIPNYPPEVGWFSNFFTYGGMIFKFFCLWQGAGDFQNISPKVVGNLVFSEWKTRTKPKGYFRIQIPLQTGRKFLLHPCLPLAEDVKQMFTV